MTEQQDEFKKEFILFKIIGILMIVLPIIAILVILFGLYDNDFGKKIAETIVISLFIIIFVSTIIFSFIKGITILKEIKNG